MIDGGVVVGASGNEKIGETVEASGIPKAIYLAVDVVIIEFARTRAGVERLDKMELKQRNLKV